MVRGQSKFHLARRPEGDGECPMDKTVSSKLMLVAPIIIGGAVDPRYRVDCLAEQGFGLEGGLGDPPDKGNPCPQPAKEQS